LKNRNDVFSSLTKTQRLGAAAPLAARQPKCSCRIRIQGNAAQTRSRSRGARTTRWLE
jgi:hypothetical protein